MRLFLFLLLTLAPFAAQGAWIVKSEFQLQLSEKLFDDLIADFWKSLQGQQTIDLGSMTVNAQGIPVHIQGIRADVNFSFPVPSRVPGGAREWELHSENLGARIRVNKIFADHTVVQEVDGIIIEIPIHAECNNVVLKLPEGLTHVSARVRAEVEHNQVKLSMPHYDAEWTQGAWQVESMQCSDNIQGITELVKREALAALSSFQNFDTEVRGMINENFDNWSKEASLLLLSEMELPSGKDYLKIRYNAVSAVENGAGLLLGGQMRFEYPYVAPGQTIENAYELEAGVGGASANAKKAVKMAGVEAVPQLLLPFATVRALMMGEYFAGKLEYSLRADEIPAFQEFMKSRWSQFWAFPELRRYPVSTNFAFQFLPMGPPAFENEKAGADNSISAELNIPLGVRMFAPLEGGVYKPMVEFRTLVSGSTKLKLLKGGKVELQLAANEHPVTYTWNSAYVANYRPNKRIAAETIGAKVRSTLNADGLTVSIPGLTVGKSLQLVPERWNLEGKNLRLDFSTKK